MTTKARTADPYRDLDVIDARGPRTNQAVIGALSLVALSTGIKWLPGLLALQLAIGLLLGRRFCLPCLAYFELIQPRFGEGPLEDARPPRFANLIGLAFLGTGTVLLYSGAGTAGWILVGIVAALALLAAATGLCMGCEAYRLSARLRGVAAKHVRQVDLQEVGLSAKGAGGFVHFTHPLCSECLEWERRLEQEPQPHAIVDVRDHPELAHKYGVAVVPTVVAVTSDGTVVERLAP